MSIKSGGHYPIENRPGEIERLLVQAEAMEPDAEIMLDRIGVKPGWVCLDAGCGPGGIINILSARVGKSGRVVGLDKDQVFLDHARSDAPGNVEFHLDDGYQSSIEANTFDLVHMRFVASTAGQPEALLSEAVRLARPGGIVALQEPDGSSLNCFPPHQAWDRLKTAMMEAFEGVGADITLARKLYFLARRAGLRDVQYRTFMLAVRASDPMVDYLPATVESIRETVIRLDLIPENEFADLLSACRAHLRDPDTSFTMYTVAQVWGTTTPTST